MIDFLDIIKRKIKPPVSTKWQEVYNIMSVHTQGEKPSDIFRQRRPLESENPSILNFRIENHRPVTKDEFDKAIADYITTAMSIDMVVNYGDSDVKEFEQKIKIFSGHKKFDLKTWIISYAGAYRQTDPNAVIAIMPKHTKEVFVPSYLEDIPNFDDIISEKVEVEIKIIPSSRIVYLDETCILFTAGNYIYNSHGNIKPYYFGVTPQQTFIIVPKEVENKVIYEQISYYQNSLPILPIIPIGGKQIIERYEEDLITYYVSDYHGAAAWGDLAIGQGSDLRVCEIRFVYPRHWRIKVKCDNNSCNLIDDIYTDIEHNSTCKRCNGTGYIQDTTPMGTLMIDKGGTLLGDDGKFTEPEGFIAPPAEILSHSADREKFYFDKMMQSLCVLQQNMTNQSGESKAYDVEHKVDVVSRIVIDLTNMYASALNIIDLYRGGTGEISISLPETLDVRNSYDILTQLTEAKKKGAPYPAQVELTKKFMLKNFGGDHKNKYIIDFLANNDKLFALSQEELPNAKAILGSDISSKDIVFHNLGYTVLKKMVSEDENILLAKEDEILQKLNDRLSVFITTTQSTLI